MDGIEDVKRELETKREEIALELQAASEVICGLESDLKRIEDALGALTGKKAKGRSRSKKPVPTVEELREHVVSVRAELPFADGEKLEETVRARVKKAGKSLAGFAALYGEALSGAAGTFDLSRDSLDDHLPLT